MEAMFEWEDEDEDKDEKVEQQFCDVRHITFLFKMHFKKCFLHSCQESEHRGFMDKLYAIQDVFISVQSALDEAASYGERIKKWVLPSETVEDVPNRQEKVQISKRVLCSFAALLTGRCLS